MLLLLSHISHIFPILRKELALKVKCSSALRAWFHFFDKDQNYRISEANKQTTRIEHRPRQVLSNPICKHVGKHKWYLKVWMYFGWFESPEKTMTHRWRPMWLTGLFFIRMDVPLTKFSLGEVLGTWVKHSLEQLFFEQNYILTHTIGFIEILPVIKVYYTIQFILFASFWVGIVEVPLKSTPLG